MVSLRVFASLTVLGSRSTPFIEAIAAKSFTQLELFFALWAKTVGVMKLVLAVIATSETVKRHNIAENTDFCDCFVKLFTSVVCPIQNRNMKYGWDYALKNEKLQNDR